MIANGAQRVRAHERPTQATMNVAPAWEVMIKVANIARAKNTCPHIQSWEMRSLFECDCKEELPSLKAFKRSGRKMLAMKATTAKRKLANVPKRMASSLREFLSPGVGGVDESRAFTRPSSAAR